MRMDPAPPRWHSLELVEMIEFIWCIVEIIVNILFEANVPQGVGNEWASLFEKIEHTHSSFVTLTMTGCGL